MHDDVGALKHPTQISDPILSSQVERAPIGPLVNPLQRRGRRTTPTTSCSAGSTRSRAVPTLPLAPVMTTRIDVPPGNFWS
jgi:hypothetical protein